jgi:phosphoribosylformimino-5-aminoimidazole carboxamide ribotide isomerase
VIVFAAVDLQDGNAVQLVGGQPDRPIIERIIASASVPVQVGGGIRDETAVAQWLDAGAARVIVGTRAVEDPPWLVATASAFPHQLVVAGDVRGGIILTRGWTDTLKLRLHDLLDRLNHLPLAAVLITDVGREGRLTGIDSTLFTEAVARSRHPVYAAGGIAGPADLLRLRALGAGGAVLGMALYTGAIDATHLEEAAL